MDLVSCTASEFARFVHDAAVRGRPVSVELVRRLAFRLEEDLVEMSTEFGAMNDGRWTEFADAVKIDDGHLVVRMDRFNYERNFSERMSLSVRAIMRNCKQFATAAVAELPDRDTWTSILLFKGRRDRWYLKDLVATNLRTVQIQCAPRRHFALAVGEDVAVVTESNMRDAVRRACDLELLTRGSNLQIPKGTVLVRAPSQADVATWDGKVMRCYEQTRAGRLDLIGEIESTSLHLPSIDSSGTVVSGRITKVTGTADGLDIKVDLATRSAFPELGAAAAMY